MDYSVSQLPDTNESLIFFTDPNPKKDHIRVNVFDMFSKGALDTITAACDLSKQYGSSSCTPYHLLYTLILKERSSLNLTEQTSNILKEAALKNILNTAKDFKGVVYLTPDTKKVLLAAYFVAIRNTDELVQSTHLVSALSAFPELAELFVSAGFVEDRQDRFFIPNSMSEYAVDLTSSASSAAKDYMVREDEIKSILRILTRETKNNVILLGEEGVGKTVVATGVGNFVKNNKSPNLSELRVVSLDIGALFSLTGSSKSTLSGIIDSSSSMGRVVFFLDNINLLNTKFQLSQLTDFLQSMQKKANVSFIISVTPSYYKEFIVDNSYFLDVSEVVHVDELSDEATEKILEAEAPRIEKFGRLTIEKSSLKEAITLSKRYLPGRLPQKAISLLEDVAAGNLINKKPDLTVDDIREIVAKKTGVPINSLSISEAQKLKDMEKLLAENVVGQKSALKVVSEALRRSRAGLKDSKRPIGSFLFLGPTGVGKTELAKTLAKLMFNDSKSFFRFDMSEYAESFTAQRLIGSPPGYVGYEEGGQLTNKVLARPYCLILFDEIEKAHPRVFDLFLQILDDGRLTDSRGMVVDFRNTLIIFTSNIASREIFDNNSNLMDPHFDRKKFYDDVVMPIVRNYFRPELINRFDDIVIFNSLTKEELVEIARLKINELALRLKEKNIRLEVGDEALKKIVDDSFDPAFGARPLEREIRSKIENPLAAKIVAGEIKGGDVVQW